MNNKKVILAIGIGICLLIVGIIAVSYIWTPTHEEEWYNSSWEYRKPITLSSEKSFTDYQVKLTIDHIHGMKEDFSDLRFAASDGKTELSYWIENTTDSSATVWVRMPAIKAEEKIEIYMYYGNDGGESASDEYDTFYLGGLGGSAEKVRVVEDIAYVTFGYGGLYVFDVLDPQKPLLIGSVDTSGYAFDLIIDSEKRIAYVADWDKGLEIVDTSDPRNPKTIGSLDTPGNARGIYVDKIDKIAYIADWDAGLRIIEIEDPANPKEIGYCNTEGNSWDVFVNEEENVAYLLNENELLFIDVTNLSEPHIIDTFNLSKTNPVRSHGMCIAVNESSKIAYVADNSGLIRIIDLNIDKHKPAELSTYVTKPGIPWDIYLGKDNIVYAAGRGGGLWILDVKNPSQPQELFGGWTYTPAHGIFVDENKRQVYLSEWARGLHIIDIGDINNPKPIGSFTTLASSWDVLIDGNLAYVTNDYTGLRIMNTSDPKDIKTVGYHSGIGNARVVYFDKDEKLAYVTYRQGGFTILDVSDPSSPSIISHLPSSSNSRGLFVDDKEKIAYIANQRSFWIVDIKDPENPTELSEVNVSYITRVVYVDTTRKIACVADYKDGVIIFDVTDPKSPKRIENNLDLTKGLGIFVDEAKNIAFLSTYAYGKGRNAGMYIINITNLRNPEIVSYLRIPGENCQNYDIFVDSDNNIAYLASRNLRVPSFDVIYTDSGRWREHNFSYGGVYIIDVSDYKHPKILNKYLSQFPTGLYIDKEHLRLYVADEGAGLRIFSLPRYYQDFSIEFSEQEIRR